MQSWCRLLVAYLIVSSLLVDADKDDEEVGNENPFTYVRCSEKGPSNWGNLKPEWRVCRTGKLQSPINIADSKVVVVPEIGQLRRTYTPARATIKNRGHDIMVKWHGDAGGVVINGTMYELQQCHWHFPTEHTINGNRYKMETHLVHKSSAGKVAVIGILHRLGPPDSFLEKVRLMIQLLHHVRNVSEEPTEIGIINPRDIKFGPRKYYRYIGSLTVPPCTEGVIWTILNKVKTVSIEQMRELRDAVHDGFDDNARPIHQSHGRSIFLFLPPVHDKPSNMN
ncbi:alpha carbonic anhydrase 4-like [Andrographis paniculata]|uniref:alpha carbonic anhydrase 4-like n=1 Tax=Andrographis paniculata TaxID=175694 RepID=UPI0021E6FA21|nr:alpha carbonic anhydrase 4-like [Andrographis paniculata]